LKANIDNTLYYLCPHAKTCDRSPTERFLCVYSLTAWEKKGSKSTKVCPKGTEAPYFVFVYQERPADER